MRSCRAPSASSAVPVTGPRRTRRASHRMLSIASGAERPQAGERLQSVPTRSMSRRAAAAAAAIGPRLGAVLTGVSSRSERRCPLKRVAYAAASTPPNEVPTKSTAS